MEALLPRYDNPKLSCHEWRCKAACDSVGDSGFLDPAPKTSTKASRMLMLWWRCRFGADVDSELGEPKQC